MPDPQQQDQQIEGLPPGAIVRPIRQPQQRIEGLPPGAIVRPIQQNSAPQPPASPEDVAAANQAAREAMEKGIAGTIPGGELGLGAAKGALHTLDTLGRYLEEPVPADRAKRSLLFRTTHPVLPSWASFSPQKTPLEQQLTTASDAAQKFGYGGEQAGEFFLPGGAVGDAAKGIDAATDVLKARPVLREAARLFGNAAVEGATTGAVNKAQGGSFKTGAELGAGTPLAGAVASKALRPLAEKASPALGNKILRPLGRAFDFGKNPGKAISEEGIVATGPEDLANKLAVRKTQVGRTIDHTVRANMNPASVTDVKPLVNGPVDKAIQRALDSPSLDAQSKKVFIDRLNGLRESLLNEHELDATGQVVVKGPRNTNLNALELSQLKRQVGDNTAWSGQPFESEINKVRRDIYGGLKQSIEKQVPGVRRLNERYGNLLSAEQSMKRRIPILQRNNTIGLTDALAGVGAGAMEGATHGGVAGAALGAGVAGGSKAVKSVLGRTARMRGMTLAPRVTPGLVRLARNAYLGKTSTDRK